MFRKKLKTEKSKLIKLDLSNNFLQHLSKAYFKNMPDLQILRLHGNKINYLTQESGLYGIFVKSYHVKMAAVSVVGLLNSRIFKDRKI